MTLYHPALSCSIVELSLSQLMPFVMLVLNRSQRSPFVSAPGGTRTHALRLKRPLLYQLSYRGKRLCPTSFDVVQMAFLD